MVALSERTFCRCGMAARAAVPSSPNAASDSTASSMLVTRSVCCASSITGLPQICTLASPPNPNNPFFSLAFTSSEIKSRLPAAAMLPRVAFKRGIVADPLLHRADLIGNGLVDQRLDLRRDIDPGACQRRAGVAQIDLGGQIRFDVPGHSELRARGDRDVALDLRVGIQRFDVHAADLLGDIVAEQSAERVPDRAGCL